MIRRRGALLAGLAVFALLAGCTNMPPPPLVAAPVAKPSSGKPAKTTEAVVGVDSVAGGYNPHTVANQSMITTALAAVLLPSVFRPGPDGTPLLDRTLMKSAQVTKAEPYTVTYEVRPDASWSDASPIAAEDFRYLAEQMRVKPGVINAAGYRLISNITARDAGKTVEVTFEKPYPGWRTLFDALLPGHLLKDQPGGWEAALADGYPVTGGPFAVTSLDRSRGEVALERNERYWEHPPQLERVMLRRADQDLVIDQVRRGQNQMALLHTDAAGLAQLSGLGRTAAVSVVPRSTVATVVLRPVTDELADARVRRALAALLDRDALIAAGSSGGASLRAEAQVLAPAAPGYQPRKPVPGVDPALAQSLLVQAGYTRTVGAWLRDGKALTLNIGVPVERENYVTMAKAVQRQLAAAGIEAKVTPLPSDQLYAALGAPVTAKLPENPINIAVLPQPSGGDPATILASNFGCVPSKAAGSTALAGNLLGYCDNSLEPTIEAALTGATQPADALAVLEPVLWREALAVPLYQEADSLAVRPEMIGVGPGHPPVGPFGDAVGWRRTSG